MNIQQQLVDEVECNVVLDQNDDYFLIMEILGSMKPDIISNIYKTLDIPRKLRLVEWLDEYTSIFGEEKRNEILKSIITI